MFDAVTQDGVIGRARDKGIYQLVAWNPRDFAQNAYRTVDDRPYGGGPGMVMMAEPVGRALGDPGFVCEWLARLSALHAAGSLRRTEGAAGVVVGQSRRYQSLAVEAGAGQNVAAQAGFAGKASVVRRRAQAARRI